MEELNRARRLRESGHPDSLEDTDELPIEIRHLEVDILISSSIGRKGHMIYLD